MKKDQGVIEWLKNNNPVCKEDVYKNFEKINTEIIDFHLQQFYPNLLKCDDVDKSESVPPVKNKTSARQVVIKYVMNNSDVTNKELFEIFPDLAKVTVRDYRRVALSKMEIFSSEKNEVNENLENKDEITSYVHTSSCENELNLAALEKKAYGTLSTAEKTNNIPEEMNDELGSKDLKLIEEMIDKKIDEKIKKFVESSKLMNEQIEEGIDKIIDEKIERSLEKKLNELIVKKISEIGTNLISNTIGKMLGNISLNSLLDGKN